MTKDEILEKSRKENKGYMDEREEHINQAGAAFAFCFGLLLCCLIFLIVGLCQGPDIIMNTAGTIFLGMLSAHFLYFAIRTRNLLYWFLSFCGVISFIDIAVSLVEKIL